MRQDGKGSVWMYVLGGCVVLVLLVVIAVVAIGYFGYQTAKEMKEVMTDPVARTDKALDILGGESLPGGYNAMFAMTIPVINIDILALTDKMPDEDGSLDEFGESGFLYIKTFKDSRDDAVMDDIFEGRKTMKDLFQNTEVNGPIFWAKGGEELGRGKIERDDMFYRHISRTGRIMMEDGRVIDGISTLIMMECPDDEKLRLGAWFSSDQPEMGAEVPVLEGTIADEIVIRDFMSHVHPCR